MAKYCDWNTLTKLNISYKCFEFLYTKNILSSTVMPVSQGSYENGFSHGLDTK